MGHKCHLNLPSYGIFSEAKDEFRYQNKIQKILSSKATLILTVQYFFGKLQACFSNNFESKMFYVPILKYFCPTKFSLSKVFISRLF